MFDTISGSRLAMIAGLAISACIATLCSGVAQAEGNAFETPPSVSIERGPTNSDHAIRWRVENPFRLFSRPQDTERHRQIFLNLPEDLRGRPILAAEQQLGREEPKGWARNVYLNTCWQLESSKYGPCPDGSSYINPESHSVVVWLERNPRDVAVVAATGGSAGGSTQPGNGSSAGIGGSESSLPADEMTAVGEVCTWTFIPTPATGARRARVVDSQAIVKYSSCAGEVTFDVPYPHGGRLTVTTSTRNDQNGPQVSLGEMIVVRDSFVVGIGDSFASGDGNPDVPVTFDDARTASYGSDPADALLSGFPARAGAWEKIGDGPFLEASAKWQSQSCHRSLYSHQLRAALQLSLEDPHRAVTYAGFACAGAEVINGLFLPYKGTEWSDFPPILSQLSAVADAQCGTITAPLEKRPYAYSLNGAVPQLNDVFVSRCPRERARAIDLLFVSIGGNDVGFSRLVANAVLADETGLRRLGGWIGQLQGSNDVAAQLRDLANRYKALNRAIHNLLHIPWSQSDRIILTAYPVLALLSDRKSICPDGTSGMTVYSGFRLSEEKARDGEIAAEKLHGLMRETAAEFNWSFADRHRDEFAGHSICAGVGQAGANSDDDLSFPRQIAGAWEPFAPSAYRPFAPRQRWYRTPNDAFLTAHFHIGTSVAKRVLRFDSLSWFQVVLAATYSGAFHPTAEGQAVIADSLVEQARRIVEKYRKPQ